MTQPIRSSYTHLVIHPLNEDGAREVWGSYIETRSHLGSFETDSIIGWIYQVDGYWVWVNEMGHPSSCFAEKQDLINWIKIKCESVDWLPEPDKL